MISLELPFQTENPTIQVYMVYNCDQSSYYSDCSSFSSDYLVTSDVQRVKCKNCGQIYLLHTGMTEDEFCSIDCQSNAHYIAGIYKAMKRQQREIDEFRETISPRNIVTSSLSIKRMLNEPFVRSIGHSL